MIKISVLLNFLFLAGPFSILSFPQAEAAHRAPNSASYSIGCTLILERIVAWDPLLETATLLNSVISNLERTNGPVRLPTQMGDGEIRRWLRIQELYTLRTGSTLLRDLPQILEKKFLASHTILRDTPLTREQQIGLARLTSLDLFEVIHNYLLSADSFFAPPSS